MLDPWCPVVASCTGLPWPSDVPEHMQGALQAHTRQESLATRELAQSNHILCRRFSQDLDEGKCDCHILLQVAPVAKKVLPSGQGRASSAPLNFDFHSGSPTQAQPEDASSGKSFGVPAGAAAQPPQLQPGYAGATSSSGPIVPQHL